MGYGSKYKPQTETYMADETKIETPKDVLVADDTDKGIQVWLAEFTSGEAKNLKYHYVKIVDYAKAAAFYGADKLLDAINSIVKQRLAVKVRNTKFPDTGNEARDQEEWAKLRALYPDGVVFSMDDALAYKIGERETGLKELLEDAQKELVETLVKGQMPGPELIAKVAELRGRVEARKRGPKTPAE